MRLPTWFDMQNSLIDIIFSNKYNEELCSGINIAFFQSSAFTIIRSKTFHKNVTLIFF